MTDLKNLSMAELNELEKAIKAEKEGRGVTYKSCLITSDWFRREFDEDIKKKGITYDRWYWDYDRSIFKICDLTLGNYAAKARKNTNDQKTIVLGGPIIEYGSVDPDLYKAMVDDLCGVIQKYHKLSKEEMENDNS